MPIINILNRLIDDGVDFRITISLSPPLISMMSDKLLQNRYLIRLNQLIELAIKEVERTKGTEFEGLARMYLYRFMEVRDTFVIRCNKDLLRAFRQLFETGKVELITSCATHGYLPLMVTKESIRAQVAVAVDLFSRHFGSPPKGMWLPECGFSPGVDQVLSEFGILYFFTDSHGITFATPSPEAGVYSPMVTPSGVDVFGRDPETSRQVWDKHFGYPGDYYYREFYRDIGYDLDLPYINGYIGEDGLRIDTGLKYFRITGSTNEKQVYEPERANLRAAEHAENFIFNRVKQLEQLSSGMENPPIITAPYDAELFGHWWYEGPNWIDFVFRKIHYDQNTVKAITPLEYLEKHPVVQMGLPAGSSWGHNGFNEMWLDSSNAWIYRHLNKAEERMVQSAAANRDSSGLTKRALNQMARELLLAQSSDWAFIIKNGTTVEYAKKRIYDHVSRFNRLYWATRNHELNEDEIACLEELDPIFPELDCGIYLPEPTSSGVSTSKIMSNKQKISVLMLSWEFPPRTVGGLSRHVYDLSQALAAQGVKVHVITCHVPGTVSDELVGGVFVHRVYNSAEDTEGFVEWIEQLNEAMIKRAEQLLEIGRFDIIHAHDWLTAHAGIMLKNSYKIPLVSTIHATEFGRNHGIHNDIQRKINQIEWKLTFESWKVICCSKYMACEISQVFQLPGDKIMIIPNGVEVTNITPSAPNLTFREQYAASFEKIIYFVGRLVPEKGVQVLIDAIPMVLERYPDAKFIVSGVGSYREVLMAKARQLGVSHKVFFTGFADDYTRNMLLASSDTAVFPSLYEPFGIVALEAMAAKVPVIVSNTGGLSEVIEDGTDGLKVTPNNSQELANAIVRILSDGGQAERLKQAAWDKVNSVYNWSVIAADTVSVYRETLDDAETNGFISSINTRRRVGT